MQRHPGEVDASFFHTTPPRPPLPLLFFSPSLKSGLRPRSTISLIFHHFLGNPRWNSLSDLLAAGSQVSLIFLALSPGGSSTRRLSSSFDRMDDISLTFSPPPPRRTHRRRFLDFSWEGNCDGYRQIALLLSPSFLLRQKPAAAPDPFSFQKDLKPSRVYPYCSSRSDPPALDQRLLL